MLSTSKARAALMAGALGLVIGCGGAGSETPSGAPSPPTIVSFTATTITLGLPLSASAEHANYNLYRSLDDNTYTLIEPGILAATHQDTGLSPTTTYYYKLTDVDQAGVESPRSVAVMQTTANLEPTVYVATHFVAPFAQVAGAGSDTDTAGGTPFAAATSAGTPCTLGEAMAEAQPGDVIEVAPGVYTGEHVGGRWDPAFAPSHSGAPGNPIIFFARYPATANTEGRSELRHTGTPGPVLGPGRGETPTSDVIFDGFYIDSSQNAIAASGGTVQLHLATRCEYRRMYFDQNTEWGDGSDNYNMIFTASSVDSVISDCVFQSTGDYLGHHNLASIETYDTENLVIQHSEFRDVGVGIFAKGDSPDIAQANSVVARFNRFTGCSSNAIELGVSDGPVGHTAYQNLSYANRGVGGAIRFENSGGGYKNNKFFNNTVQGGVFVRGVDGEFGGGNQLYDNILFDGTRNTDYNQNVEVAHDYGVTDYHNPYDYFSLADYNLFWRSDGTPVSIGGNEAALFATELTLGQWQAGLANAGLPPEVRQANSIEVDPEFVDLANHDYRLADHGQAALTASSTGGPVGCYITGNEEIGLRAAPAF